MVTIDRERLISEKQNNKASAEGARLPKEAMLLRDIFKLTKPSLDEFRPFGLSRANEKMTMNNGNRKYQMIISICNHLEPCDQQLNFRMQALAFDR